jgi:hypothetical protein
MKMTQPMPTVGKEDVTAEVLRIIPELIKQRQQKGIETYGTSMQTFNGRDPFQDAIEELVDALQYIVQAQMEYRVIKSAYEKTIGCCYAHGRLKKVEEE